MFKEKEARKKIPLSYLELVIDKIKYNQQVQSQKNPKPKVLLIYLRMNFQQIKFEMDLEPKVKKVRYVRITQTLEIEQENGALNLEALQ